MQNIIESTDVSKKFGATQAVDDLSLRVPQGQVCGLLGPNGAGKTTSIRMIMNIIRPDSGSVSILGQDAGQTARSRAPRPQPSGPAPERRMHPGRDDGTDDSDGTGTPAVIHYIHGPSGLEPTAISLSSRA